MMINCIMNEDCLKTMKEMEPNSIDMILTSPPYNMTSRRGGISDTGRYDLYNDWKTEDEYINWTIDIFNNFYCILNDNGVVAYNFGYSIENPALPYLVVSNIINNTNFYLCDTIIWKKKNGLPFPAQEKRLSRIWEYVFIFCKNKSIDTYFVNKGIKSISEKTGQRYYNIFYNYIEAKNNDVKCKYNQATYSTDLCKWLLKLYCPIKGIVYDPFMGSGTTAVACKKMNLNYIGSEISKNQCDFAICRINMEKINE